jgi:hypothetical protein
MLVSLWFAESVLQRFTPHGMGRNIRWLAFFFSVFILGHRWWNWESLETRISRICAKSNKTLRASEEEFTDGSLIL